MTALTAILPALICLPPMPPQSRIDRHALVSRHNVTLTAFDGKTPLQVGNGEFAFGMDITGLQSFAPFNTMSHWGWNSSPLPPGTSLDQYQRQAWETHGRSVLYPLPDPAHPALSDWLAGNPHAINLGRVGLEMIKSDGTVATQADLTDTVQKLDLWTGIVTSRFKLEGQPVTVTTCCHPTLDAIAVQVTSPLIQAGRLRVFIDCPGDNGAQFANFVGDATRPGRFELQGQIKTRRGDFIRRLDSGSYHVSLAWEDAAALHQLGDSEPLTIVKAEYGADGKWLDVTETVKAAVHEGRLSIRATNNLGQDPAPGLEKTLRVTYVVNGANRSVSVHENEEMNLDASAGLHQLTLQPSRDEATLSFVCAFAPNPLPKRLPNATGTIQAGTEAWPKFWNSGGALDLSGSRDPRWRELERRVVLSQYLMKVNEAGSQPPQESGLVNNGWFGRFHLEMYWWHAAHWALWNRWPELDRSLGLYARLLPKAEETAKGEGYLGARWPKCIGPDGREWPFYIHSFLIWQQPHPIFFAELDYRAHATRATLQKWWPVVKSTADFMATYAFLEKVTQVTQVTEVTNSGSYVAGDKQSSPQSNGGAERYVLGPPIVFASENNEAGTTQNPTFELGYWRFGLRIAQAWRERLGLKPNPAWAKVQMALSPLPVQDGVYVLHEGVKDMWTKFNFEHPALTATLGLLPGDGVDRETMRRTLDKIAATWNFQRTWGWDYPMLAMCAARLGEPDRAIEFLLTEAEGFQFDARGFATGGPFPYLPSNGGLLYAVAMMAAGWDGASNKHAPGFPADGQWKVRWENLSVAP